MVLSRASLLGMVILLVGLLCPVSAHATPPGYVGSAYHSAYYYCQCNKTAAQAAAGGMLWSSQTCEEIITAAGYAGTRWINSGTCDADGTGLGVNCSCPPPADADGDGEPDSSDVCPTNFCNNCASDTDGDGTMDSDDPDIDGDGIENGEDPDIDGDCVPNAIDPCPTGSTRSGTTAGYGNNGYGLPRPGASDNNSNGVMDSQECVGGGLPTVCYSYKCGVNCNPENRTYSAHATCHPDTLPCYCEGAHGCQSTAAEEVDCDDDDEDDPDDPGGGPGGGGPTQPAGCVNCETTGSVLPCPFVPGMIRLCCPQCPTGNCDSGYGHCTYVDEEADADGDGIPNGADTDVRCHTDSEDSCADGSCMCSEVTNMFLEITNFVGDKFGVQKFRDQLAAAEAGEFKVPSMNYIVSLDGNDYTEEFSWDLTKVFVYDRGAEFLAALRIVRRVVLFFFGLSMLPAFINQLRP